MAGKQKRTKKQSTKNITKKVNNKNNTQKNNTQKNKANVQNDAKTANLQNGKSANGKTTIQPTTKAAVKPTTKPKAEKVVKQAKTKAVKQAPKHEKPKQPKPQKKPKQPRKPLSPAAKKRLMLVISLFVICCCALSGVAWIFFHNNALAVLVNGEQIGIMEQSSTTSDKFKMLVAAKMKEKAGNELEIDDNIELAAIHSPKKKIESVDTVLSNVCDVISYKQKAIAINVNSEQLVIVANQEIADKVCQEALDAYEVPAGTENPQFADNVDTAEVYVEGSSVSGENVALSKMTEMKPEERTHTVVAGESFGMIATNFNMTQDELFALNPDLTQDSVKALKIGQTIKVTVKVPVVAIKTTQTVTSEEEIPYTSEVTENQNEKKTYRKVITEGKNGTKEVTAEVTYVNGIKTSTKVTNEKIITEAVNEKVEVGTLGDEAQSASGSFIFPVTGTISSVFGPRNYGNGKHYGVDIAAGAGNPVHAADSGTVTFAGWNSGGYGNLVIIDHGNGFVTYYAHNSQLCVNKGDKVNQGTTIALVGTTGDSTGNHCHFEVVHNGQKVDPFNYLSMN